MEDVLMEYKPLIYSISKKFYGIDKQDLIQAGFLGLMKAYKNYKGESQCKFSTYAYEYIYGEMYEAVNGEKLVHVRKDAMRLYKSVIKYKELLSNRENREVSYKETCEMLKIDYNDFLSILNSLSASVDIDNNELNLSKNEYMDDLILLKEALEKLNDIEKEVMKNRYMLDMSQDETAKKMGLSQVKVSRLERSSKEKMREFAKS